MSNINLQQFRQQVTRPQRLAKFEVLLYPTQSILEAAGITNAENLRYKAEAVQMPSIEFKNQLSIPRYGFGLIEPFPSRAEFQPIVINFIIEEDNHEISKLMYNWIQKIFFVFREEVSFRDIYTIGFKEDYSCTIDIIALSEGGEETQKISLISAFPVSIAYNPMSWNNSTDYQNMIVQFNCLVTKLYFKEILKPGQSPVSNNINTTNTL
jgi:hypothetical protein